MTIATIFCKIITIKKNLASKKQSVFRVKLTSLRNIRSKYVCKECFSTVNTMTQEICSTEQKLTT